MTRPLALLILIVGLSENVHFHCKPNYYWRNYDGRIPNDAVIGGADVNGNPFYVGQAYFRHNELLVATIFPGKKIARASAYNKVLETDNNVKILCSPYPHNFKWVRTESKDLHLLTNTHVIIGGSEVGQVLYIGRVFQDKETVIGKIFQNHLGNRGIWIPNNGQEKNYLSYDILTYNCDITNLHVVES